MPALVSAATIGAVCTLVRTSTATSPVRTSVGSPAATSAAMPVASASSSLGSISVTAAPSGRLDTSSAGWSLAARTCSPARHDLGRTPVVHRQPDDLDAGKASLDVDEQGRVGAVESVDRLRRVTDEEEIVASGTEDVDELMLERVEVLGLVDEDVAEPPSERVGEVVVSAEFADRVRQHVVEIDDAPTSFERLVALERRGALLDAGSGTTL